VILPPGGHYLLDNALDQERGLTLPEGVTADQDLGAESAFGVVGSFAGIDGVQVQAPDGTITDSVGYTNTIYADGTGLTPLNDPDAYTAFVRRFSAGQPVDTGDNAADFQLVAPDAATASYGQTAVLGTPAPSNTASPRQVNQIAQSYLLDPSVGEEASPNLTFTPPQSGAGTESATNPGVLTIRRTVTNVSTTETITRLRLRVTGLSTYGEQSDPVYGDPSDPSGAAILADIGTPADAVNGTTDTTLDNYEPGVTSADTASTGLNSTLSIDLPTQTGGSAPGLIPGQSVNIAVSFYVYHPGQFAFAYNLEDDLKPYTRPGTTGSSTTTSTSATTSSSNTPDASTTTSPTSVQPTPTAATAVAPTLAGIVTTTGVTLTTTPHVSAATQAKKQTKPKPKAKAKKAAKKKKASPKQKKASKQKKAAKKKTAAKKPKAPKKSADRPRAVGTASNHRARGSQ